MKCQTAKLFTCGIIVSMIASGAQAATITSSDFTLQYGATHKAPGENAWTTVETSGVNSPTTQGDFTFSPAPAGSAGSDTGPTFPSGVFTNGSGTAVSAYTGHGDFVVPITASYNGSAPGDALGTPNYQLQIEITEISVWAARNGGATETQWLETTSGHESTQATSTGLIAWSGGAGGSDISRYNLVSWDPADYNVALGSLGDSFARSFTLPTDIHFIDGLTVKGRVHLIYDAVPEPASLGLVALGALGLMCKRRGMT